MPSYEYEGTEKELKHNTTIRAKKELLEVTTGTYNIEGTVFILRKIWPQCDLRELHACLV